jgi:hypothetical protein
LVSESLEGLADFPVREPQGEILRPDPVGTQNDIGAGRDEQNDARLN